MVKRAFPKENSCGVMSKPPKNLHLVKAKKRSEF